MPDITQLILDDHEVFRRQFAALDTTNDPDQLRAIWKPLANLLDVHAVAEETIFYPQLLRHGDDAEEETVDAVGDHNDIRDAAHEAEQYPVGSERWWDAVRRARMANSAHMAEEEDEALADFRRNSPLSLRDELGAQFLKFKADHPDARTLDTSDKDPEQYVSEVQEEIAPDGGGDGASGSGPGSGHVRGPGSGPGGGPGGGGPGGSGHGLGIGSLKGR